uniref:GDT1 family protein n=1 Tax=Aplanochytrium stocchinoi TaxID=215587 RepID=A0A7S3LMN9_9STRA|mmetsp:Transcript_3970/g.4978  ORF Transcript_3970/g.4978 Transcript_3970/m.4978 type:complete len:286 (+) Transcript_3970:627-1484(+)
MFGRYLVDEDDFFKPVGNNRQSKKEKKRQRDILESVETENEIEIEDQDNDNDLEEGGHHKDSFVFAFINSLAMIIVTELGDKTFFIAAIMAMKHKRILVYSGAIGALTVMTILSAMIGFALPTLLPKIYTHYAAVLLFLFFGGKMLQEAYEMHVSPPEHNEELAEVEEQFANTNGKSSGLEAGLVKNLPLGLKINRKQLEILSQAFTLTFLAEWGDRSQIATIALASSKNPYGVTIGGTIGHAICTGLAVLGGRMLATRISEKQVAIAGGSLFLLFALHSIITGP